jgi:hypothetical protein
VVARLNLDGLEVAPVASAPDPTLVQIPREDIVAAISINIGNCGGAIAALHAPEKLPRSSRDHNGRDIQNRASGVGHKKIPDPITIEITDRPHLRRSRKRPGALDRAVGGKGDEAIRAFRDQHLERPITVNVDCNRDSMWA